MANPKIPTEAERNAMLVDFQASQEAGKEPAKEVKVLPNLTAATSDGTARPNVPPEGVPIETTYVPTAKDKDALVREINATSDIILGHDASGETSIASALALTVADMLFLGVPNLGKREGISANGLRFNPEQSQPNLYEQLRVEATRKAEGEGVWFKVEVMETNTFKSYMQPSCRKACLLAFGYAAIGLVPKNARGQNLYKAKGTPIADIAEDARGDYVQAIMVPSNVICPVSYDVKQMRDGATEQVKDKDGNPIGKPNADTSLMYLSNEVANALYAIKFDHVGETGVQRDPWGFLLSVKPKAREAQTPGSSTTSTTKAPEAKPTYFGLRDAFMASKDLGGSGHSTSEPAIGALHGIWYAITNNEAKVSEEICRLVMCMARDAAWRVIEHYAKEENKDLIPPANLALAMAEIADFDHYCQFQDKDGGVVKFRTDPGQKKWRNIVIPDKIKDQGDSQTVIAEVQEQATAKAAAEPAKSDGVKPGTEQPKEDETKAA